MTSRSAPHLLCPSSRCEDGAQLLGIVRTGRHYLWPLRRTRSGSMPLSYRRRGSRTQARIPVPLCEHV